MIIIGRMKSTNICTIYRLSNIENCKNYIGQTWFPLNKRMGKNGSNYKNSIYLYNSIKKYGIDKFKYHILAQCSDQETADYLESYYINIYCSNNPEIGYNIKNGGSNGKHSADTINKISETLKNNYAALSLEQQLKRCGPIIGYWLGKERGKYDEERKQQISFGMVEWHKENTHPMLNKHHTDDAKDKISKSLIGRTINPESIKRGVEKRKCLLRKKGQLFKLIKKVSI